MIRRLFIGICTLALTLTAASSTFASLRTVSAGDQIRVRYSGFNYRTGNGGEFQVGLEGGPTNYFHTFCAEIGETISNNQLVNVVSIGLTSQASTPFNTLTSAAAKLYRDYYDGIAANNYGFQGGPHTK